MDAPEIIEKLKSYDLSEYEIAKRLNASGHAVSQSTVNRIATGEVTNPSYRVWRALESLYLDISRSRSAKRGSSRVAA